MKSTEKRDVHSVFRVASGFGESGEAAIGPRERRSTTASRRRGVGVLLAGCVVFVLVAFGARILDTDLADAYEKDGSTETMAAIEELRIAEREVATDISSAVTFEPAIRLAGMEPAAGALVQETPPPPSTDVPPVVEPQTVSGESAVPPTQPLAAPQTPSMKSEAQGQAKTDSVTRPDMPPSADSYYDSLPLPPSGPMAKKTAGPREVDPALEPASKFVVVTKDRAAGSVESLLVSANRALSLGRYEAAVDIFDQLRKKNSRDRRVLMGRAIALQKAGRREAAKAAYEELLVLSPDNREARVNMLGLIAENYPSVALRQMLDLRKEWPGDAGLAAQIGLTQARLGNDRDALDYLGIAASLDPSNAGHLFNMAIVADRLGDSDAAIKFYEQALQTDTLHGGGRSIPRDTIYSRLSVLRNP